MALRPVQITAERFKPYGQLIGPSPDGEEYGPQDAQLDLSAGIPRFYIMHLEQTGLIFKSITHHAKVTQCLGSVGAQPWYIAVAEPSMVDSGDTSGARQSKAGGHFYIPPSIESINIFRIDGPRFIKLHRGTWHAGPLFVQESLDFYNLELNDTNISDHTTHIFETPLKFEE